MTSDNCRDTIAQNSLQTISLSDISDQSRCDQCTAKCCGYITQALDSPRSIHDFDVLLWQIAHHGVHIFKDGNGWYLLSNAKCQFLADDNRCRIYNTRPMICREHDNQACEYDVSVDEGCYLYFENYQQLDDYCRQRYKSWDKRFKKSARQKQPGRAKSR